MMKYIIVPKMLMKIITTAQTHLGPFVSDIFDRSISAIASNKI